MVGLAITLLVTLAPQAAPASPQPTRPAQPYRAWLASPGGEIPFGLELRGRGAASTATIVNGPERIAIPGVRWSGRELVMSIPPYDSVITAKADDAGNLTGDWVKRRGNERWAKMKFGATRGEAPRFGALAEASASAATPSTEIAGRWRVQFEHDAHPSVGIFATTPDGKATGTFLTTLGDYRYLAGSAERGVLRLSCFDGAHAFLFVARAQKDGTLRGDFWSSASWHESWTAAKDPKAKLPEAFDLTTWQDGVSLSKLRYPDLAGRMRSVADFLGPNGMVIQVFGSWCPNCNDSSRYLGELHRRYRAEGVGFLGLAFEHTDDHARNAKQVEIYKARNDAEYPALVAGPSDKKAATKAFPAVDRIRSYPTTIFLDRNGKPLAIHTGFSGPATGEAHAKLRRRFQGILYGMVDRH